MRVRTSVWSLSVRDLLVERAGQKGRLRDVVSVGGLLPDSAQLLASCILLRSGMLVLTLRPVSLPCLKPWCRARALRLGRA